ncbi:MAG: hypothetical protein CM15mP89_2300 [Gammaproteobacteria bacterium]|nr:MAG: hypothetical protein CM15mP89_2300 [Gammaproteobacteria bacterium]
MRLPRPRQGRQDFRQHQVDHRLRYFIGLEGNIDGLVHLSDISWNETGEEAVRNYKKGDEIETVILSIDPERSAFRWVSSS